MEGRRHFPLGSFQGLRFMALEEGRGRDFILPASICRLCSVVPSQVAAHRGSSEGPQGFGNLQVKHSYFGLGLPLGKSSWWSVQWHICLSVWLLALCSCELPCCLTQDACSSGSSFLGLKKVIVAVPIMFGGELIMYLSICPVTDVVTAPSVVTFWNNVLFLNNLIFTEQFQREGAGFPYALYSVPLMLTFFVTLVLLLRLRNLSILERDMNYHICCSAIYHNQAL